ncbi:ABC transporter ATP-binding protein [Xylophilus sp. GOD-11R]|uniref:ABC transporter ATP-binding protein n=1 Tax=Xylophilus sp. GOD-11R TaxID=3089814 RepID=UPI00298BD20A|nr:ABC transporter ATP-binding protein [Xylophilus sp. GOD-11R]WPB57802.1 ABC transporter ATP-binding protein [Xylophilus sp. GOD-11R]
MSSEFSIIEITNLSKRYEVYTQPRDRLRQMIFSRVRRWTGREPIKYFKEFWALRDVSVSVNSGETLAIIGQNGSGKSTLLQLICRTLTPTSGEIAVNGRIAALLELGAGFNPEFSGRENVYLSGLLYGMSAERLRERYEAIVDFAEIGEFIDQPVKTYSSGMYVRLAFAIAAHVDADVLVVDEALSVGDVRFTQKCMRFLRDFQKRGTLLFVSHDTAAVVGLCSRAIWLDKGRLRMDGSAKETVEAYLAHQHALDRKEQGHVVAVKDDRLGPSRAAAPETAIDDRRWAKLRSQGALGQVAYFDFDPQESKDIYGAGGALITDACFLDADGGPLAVSHGGEIVELVMTVAVSEPLENMIFGFYFKDRLGQRLFGDNTFQTYLEKPVSAVPGEKIRARFKFRMPVLPSGAYSVDLAVASGTQVDHTQQHWLHDGLQLRASDTSMRHGLVGLPMLDITVTSVPHD